MRNFSFRNFFISNKNDEKFLPKTPENFFIKEDYKNRDKPEYFNDVIFENEKIIHQPLVYELASFLGERFSCSHIIDIGCGSANKLTLLHPKFKIVGIDYSTNIKKCKKNYDFGEWIECNLEKNERIKLPTNILKHSVIICSDVIEHLINPSNLLDNLKWIMDYSPLCLLSTPERDLVRGKNDLGPPANSFHVREWNLNELKQLLIFKGFNLAFHGLTINNNIDREKKTQLAIIEQNNSLSNFKKLSSFKVPDDFKVIAIMTSYNDEDIIVPVIKKLVEENIDVYLVDNWSTDQTYNLALSLKGKGLIGIERFPSNGPSTYYTWELILQRVEKLTSSLDASWFIHIDSDEIRHSPWPNLKLKDAIFWVDLAGYNAIDHTVLNFPPIDNNFQAGSDFEKYFEYFELGKKPGHFIQIKTWKNQGQIVSLAKTGGHDLHFKNRRVYPYKFLLKHYPIRSQKHGEKKILQDRKSRWYKPEKDKGWHTHYDDIQKDHVFLKESNNLQLFDEDFYVQNLVEIISGIGI